MKNIPDTYTSRYSNNVRFKPQPDLRGGGQTEQLPRGLHKGPPQKTVINLLPKETEKYFFV